MNTSPQVRQLRILSGAHAGASLDLNPGIHSLGRGDDCDITITDWAFEPLALHVGSNGDARAQWVDERPRSTRFRDFVPLQFGAVAVCLGPVDQAWPVDAELLAKARPPEPAGLRNLPRRALAGERRALSAVGLMMAALLTFGGFVSAISKPGDNSRMTQEAARVSLQRTLDEVAPGRMTVSTAQGVLAVDGIVDTPGQKRAVVAALANAPSKWPMTRHVSVVSELAESIRSSIGIAGAQVSYRGAGVFRVSVDSDDVAGTQASLDRVAVDLAPVVKRIEGDVHETSTVASLPETLSTMTADGVSVMETRDGVKHLVLTDAKQDVPPAAGASAASVPAGAAR